MRPDRSRYLLQGRGFAAFAAFLGGCLVLAGPVGARPAHAHAAALTFSNGYLSQLACESSGECTAIAAGGVQVTFNPTRGGSVIKASTIPSSSVNGQLAITCVSTQRCIDADARGDVAVFNPRKAKAKVASFSMTGQAYQTSISCPSHSRCVTETWQGESVFDPAHLGSPATSPFTANGNGGQPTISCPSVNQCTGTNGNSGLIYTYNPANASAAVAHTITSSPQVGFVDCPSTSLCVALASPKSNPAVNTGLMTFNPHHPGNPQVKTITPSSLEFLACASSTLCAAAGNNRGVFVFNPKSLGHRHFTGLPYGIDVVGIAFVGRSELVLFGYNGRKAVIDPRNPPSHVGLVGLSSATSIKHG